MSCRGPDARDEDVQEAIDRGLADRVRTMHLAPLLGRVLAVITEGGRHQEVLDEVNRLAARAVKDNSELIRERIERETRWWMPYAVDDKIFKRVLGAIRRLLLRTQRRPEPCARTRFDESLHRFIERLNTSPKFAARVDAGRRSLSTRRRPPFLGVSIWNDAKTRWRAPQRPRVEGVGRPRARVHGVRPKSPRRSGTDDEDGRVRRGRRRVSVARYQDEVADLIASTVAAWIPNSLHAASSWRSAAICSSSASTERSSAGWPVRRSTWCRCFGVER